MVKVDKKQKEYLEELSNTNTPLFPFDVIESKIVILGLYKEVLNKHPEEFPEEFRKRLEEKNVLMGDTLNFYILQEIQDFYRQAYLKFKDKLEFPESAGEVKNFRGKIVAHIKTKTSGDIAKSCLEFEKKYGFSKIYLEWLDFKNNLYEELKK